MTGAKEQFLLYRVRAFKDEKAFGEIYRLYASALDRFLRLQLPTPQDVEEAFSTTFLRAWNYMSASKVETAAGLIYTIARGVVADFYRSRGETRIVSVDPDLADALKDPKHPERRMEAQTDLQLLKQALKKLSDEEQLVVVLRYFEDKPIREVARQLGKSENATRVLLHRTLKKIRAMHPDRLNG